MTLTGTLTKMDWVNPHGWIYMDVKQPDGTVQKWTIETSGPSQMSRHGLKKADFVDGMPLVVKGYQGKRIRRSPTAGRWCCRTDAASTSARSAGRTTAPIQ